MVNPQVFTGVFSRQDQRTARNAIPAAAAKSCAAGDSSTARGTEQLTYDGLSKNGIQRDKTGVLMVIALWDCHMGLMEAVFFFLVIQ